MKIVQLNKMLKKTNKSKQYTYVVELGKEMFLTPPVKPITMCSVHSFK